MTGIQSVVLYSLPELDGAIDAVPLGGLCGNNIYLVPERVQNPADHPVKWHALQTKPAKYTRLMILLYRFLSGIGATGTAVLPNVPRSLELLLATLH